MEIPIIYTVLALAVSLTQSAAFAPAAFNARVRTEIHSNHKTFFEPARTKVTDAEKDEIGIAHAGGSLRAFAASYGALRGFQQKGAMDSVKYNSGISGGSIPAILYTYAGVNTNELLETDRSTDPSKITNELLSKMPESSMGSVISQKADVRKTILFNLPSIIMALINPVTYTKVHSLWSAAVYKKFFEPLHVPQDKFFTSSKDELNKILEENSDLSEDDFILPREDTKTLPMILYTMQGCRADFNRFEHNYRRIYDEAWEELQSDPKLSMTDLLLEKREKYGSNLLMPYVTTPDCVENKYRSSVQMRTKKIEFPERNARPFEWGAEEGKYGRQRRFSVEFLAGMSTNFIGTSGLNDSFQSTLASLFATGLRTLNLRDNNLMTLRFADGGSNDVAGIIPLVCRGTKNIICVYDFNQGAEAKFSNTFADTYKVANATSISDPNFDSQFEEWLKRFNPRLSCYFGHMEHIIHANVMNHIFDDPNNDRLKELMIKFNSLHKAGEPLIATLKDLKVIDNPFWGLTGGNTVNLTLMYYNMPKKFSDKVPIEAVPPPHGMPKIDENGRFNNEELRMIPELEVEDTAALKYTKKQINMMGYLGSWMVDHSWDGLRGHDGEVVFEGFRDIFDKDSIAVKDSIADLLKEVSSKSRLFKRVKDRKVSN